MSPSRTAFSRSSSSPVTTEVDCGVSWSASSGLAELVVSRLELISTVCRPSVSRSVAVAAVATFRASELLSPIASAAVAVVTAQAAALLSNTAETRKAMGRGPRGGRTSRMADCGAPPGSATDILIPLNFTANRYWLATDRSPRLEHGSCLSNTAVTGCQIRLFPYFRNPQIFMMFVCVQRLMIFPPGGSTDSNFDFPEPELLLRQHTKHACARWRSQKNAANKAAHEQR